MSPQREPVVYRLFAADGALVYVGVTEFVQRRLAQHRRLARWWPEVASVEVEHFASLEAAKKAEAVAIDRERPLWNKAGLRQHSRRCGCVSCGRRRHELSNQPGLFVPRFER